MNRATLTDIFLYRYRYSLSYVAMGLLLVGLLFVAGFLIPGGLSDSEVLSATKSGNLSLGVFIGNQVDNIAHLPYRLMQYASIHTFGLSAWTVKLPSLIIALLSIFLFYRVLRLWFRANVAVITTVILMTSSMFLLQAQLGTAGIMYLFWGALLLYSTSAMAHSTRFNSLWLIVTAVVAGLAMYSPFAVYIIVPLITAALIHPHARFIVFRQPLWALASSLLLFILAITPLAIAAINDTSVLVRLAAGSDVADGTFTLMGNLAQLSQYIDFYTNHSGRILQPAYGLGLILLAIVGLVHLISRKYTAKSYIMTVWLLLTAPILFLNPDAASVSLLPVMLLVAFGIDLLIRYWYRMFPLNPYARVAGLFPLAILVIGLSVSSLDRFVYGYRYNTDAAAAYSNDLRLIDRYASSTEDDKIQLVVPENQKSFYELYATTKKNGPTITVSSSIASAQSADQAIILADRAQMKSVDRAPTTVVTSDSTNDANRVYLYEKSAR